MARADRDQQGYSGGRASSDNPGGNRTSTGGSRGMAGFGGGQVAAPAATGLRGPLGPTGAAGHTTSNLGTGSNFQGAVSDYANNYTADPASRVAKFFTGVGLRQPNPDIPSSYAHGLAHTAVDPLGVGLGVAGAALGAPIGALYGAGKLATGWEGPQVNLGSASPGTPQPGQGFNYSGVGPQGRYGPGTGTPGTQGLGNPTGGGMSAFPAMPAQAPGGAPFGAQPATPSMAAPAAPGFTAGVPNHTLPQNYTSRFPNSLTDQDKALLYAKALGGGMG